jgi:hypothetical protein
MTFTNLIVGIVIFSFFLVGISEAIVPVINTWESTITEYRISRSIKFVAVSFTQECGKKNRDIEAWKKTVSIVKELQSYEILEMYQGSTLRALKADCIIGGEQIEIIGLCTP